MLILFELLVIKVLKDWLAATYLWLSFMWFWLLK